MTEHTKDKVLGLLAFTKQLSIMRQRIVSDVTKGLGFVWLNELLKYPEFVTVFSGDTVNKSDNDSDLLLKIVKPALEPCPQPNENIRSWLKPNWSNYKLNVEHFMERTLPVRAK